MYVFTSIYYILYLMYGMWVLPVPRGLQYVWCVRRRKDVVCICIVYPVEPMVVGYVGSDPIVAFFSIFLCPDPRFGNEQEKMMITSQ